MKNKIKFNHLYNKQTLGNCRWYGKLIQIFKCNKKDLSKEFIDYDTSYKCGKFKLPDGELIILLFLTDSNLWTTVRKYTLEKYQYYKNLIGESFGIEINEK